MTAASAPSLLSRSAQKSDTKAPKLRMLANRDANSLLDLVYDGLYVIYMIRNGYRITDAERFREIIRHFLHEFERGATNLKATSDDVYLCKFAFCALVDETILSKPSAAREAWEIKPLQLDLFGEQLAGEKFFQHLERLRTESPVRVQVLEVFHMVLLLGFQGMYVLEGSEKLHYLTARLGDEIAHIKGKRAAFAPHWAPPDQIRHLLRHEISLWVMASVFGLIAVAGFLGLQWQLKRETQADLVRYSQVINLPTQVANVTITLP